MDTLDQIKARAESMTETVRPSAPVTPLRAVPPAFKFPFVHADEIVINSAPEWAIEGLLPRQGLAAVYGPPGSGKSFLTIDACGHIAAGLDWFGRRVEQGGVVYIAAEAGTGLKKRLAAWRKAHDVAGRLPLAMVPVAPNLGTTKDGSDTAKLIADLREQAPSLGFPIRVIVIDTLARTLFGADENSAADMGAFIANAAMIADAFQCLTIAVHHSGKDAERGMRGSSALHGACDSEWEIKDGTAGEKLVTLVKNKEGEDGLSWRFKLQQTVVFDPLNSTPETSANVSAGDPVTSCVVETIAEPKQIDRSRKAQVPTGVNKVVYDAVRNAHAEHKELLPQHPDFPSGYGVRVSRIKDLLFPQGFGNSDNPTSQNAAFNRAIINLTGKDLVRRYGEWVWLCS